jgi:hypothetical protein
MLTIWFFHYTPLCELVNDIQYKPIQKLLFLLFVCSKRIYIERGCQKLIASPIPQSISGGD